MKLDKILFPTDFSTCSDAGLKWASSLARDSGATVVIVHVEEPPSAYGGGEAYYGVPEPDHAAMTTMLEAVVPHDPGIAYEHRIVSGDPAREIAALAEAEGVDLIVMGTHGRTGLKRLLMGSVTEEVVRRASCPVLTYKEPEDTA